MDISRVSDLNGNGKFLPSLVRIIISDETKNELQTLGHELVEFARAFGNSGKFVALRNAVIDFYVEKHGRAELDRQIQKYLKAYRAEDSKFNYDHAEKEFVCDFIGGILANEAGLREFVDQIEQRADLTETEKKGLLQSLLDLIRKALEKIEEFLSAGDPNSSVQLAAEAEADTARNMIRLLTEALDSASATVSQIADGTTVTITGNEGGTRFSFNNTNSGMANDALLPYDDELKSLIESKGGYIIDSYNKLVDLVDRAFDHPNEKATAYFGILSPAILSKIEKSVPNLLKELNGTLFKSGRTYSVAATLDSIQHIPEEKKGVTRIDVIDYMDRFADTIIDFDTTAFDYYYEKGQRINGLLFKKEFDDGTMVSFNLVSSSQKSIKMQTIYMEKGDYKKRNLPKLR